MGKSIEKEGCIRIYEFKRIAIIKCKVRKRICISSFFDFSIYVLLKFVVTWREPGNPFFFFCVYVRFATHEWQLAIPQERRYRSHSPSCTANLTALCELSQALTLKLDVRRRPQHQKQLLGSFYAACSPDMRLGWPRPRSAAAREASGKASERP